MVTTGALFALFAAASFAIWNIYLERGLARGAQPNLALCVFSVTKLLFFAVVVAWLAYRGLLPPMRADGLVWLLAGGLAASLAAPYLTALATPRIGAHLATSLRLLDPPIAYAIALVWLGEHLGGKAMVGVGLILAALLFLRMDARREADPAARRRHLSGVLLGIGAAVAFTLASTFRKVGQSAVPAASVAGLMEAVVGVGVALPALLLRGRFQELRSAFTAQRRDLRWAGLGATGGTLFVNLALQQAPLPVVVAIRNTSPWFVLLLSPLLLQPGRRPSRCIWASTALLTLGMLLIVWR